MYKIKIKTDTYEERICNAPFDTLQEVIKFTKNYIEILNKHNITVAYYTIITDQPLDGERVNIDGTKYHRVPYLEYVERYVTQNNKHVKRIAYLSSDGEYVLWKDTKAKLNYITQF